MPLEATSIQASVDPFISFWGPDQYDKYTCFTERAQNLQFFSQEKDRQEKSHQISLPIEVVEGFFCLFGCYIYVENWSMPVSS